ncbi:MAG TPA: TIGR02453 family protein, partial [Cytophagales bacterium]|nr:TIGR02453 family protein [Cytophagales bacterium]
MIQESTLHFLTDLQENNHKEWFDANRKRYDAAKKNFLAVTTELLEGLAKQDEAIAQADLDPKKTLTRINRDIRFSKDKTPYNAHFFTTLSAGGKKSPMAGYYLRVSPDESFHGGGVYMPDNAVLGKIRQEIDYHVEEWKAIVEGPELTTHYGALQTNGALSRPPKGY